MAIPDEDGRVEAAVGVVVTEEALPPTPALESVEPGAAAAWLGALTAEASSFLPVSNSKLQLVEFFQIPVRSVENVG